MKDRWYIYNLLRSEEPVNVKEAVKTIESMNVYEIKEGIIEFIMTEHNENIAVTTKKLKEEM